MKIRSAYVKPTKLPTASSLNAGDVFRHPDGAPVFIALRENSVNNNLKVECFDLQHNVMTVVPASWPVIVYHNAELDLNTDEVVLDGVIRDQALHEKVKAYLEP